jgi:DNA-binding NtrC family response regulator
MSAESTSILLVDDNKNLTKSMSFILTRKGYSVETANDGFEAIDIVKERTFDIILMDIKMPHLDGVETYKRIKKIDPDAVVMMMTAYSVEEMIEEALQEGAFGIMYKPLNIEHLLDVVDKIQSKKEGGLILIVEDDKGTRLTLKSILARQGYKVAICANGDEALLAASENDFDILLIDMKLPTINGLETYLAIKKIKPEVIAVMMTGYRQEVAELVQEALDHSAYTCLYKPLVMPQVLQLLEEILRRKKSAEI